MRTTIAAIILFGLAFWLHGQTGPLSVSSGKDSITLTEAQLKAAGISTPITSSSTALVFTPATGKEVLRVTGLAEIRLGNPSPYQGIMYDRPEKPETIGVILTTKDGRQWRAKWEEIPAATPSP